MTGREWGADITHRGDRVSIRELKRTFEKISGVARQMLLNVMLILTLAAGVSATGSPAQAQTETFDEGGRTIDYVDGHYGVLSMGHYLIQDGTGAYVMMFYKTINIQSGKTYTSAEINYDYTVNRGDGSAVNISLMSAEPSYDAAGFSLIRTSPSVGGFVLPSGRGTATASLSSAVVDEMNRLSAAGGGRFYLGVSLVSPTVNASASLYPFDLVAGFVPEPTITSVSPASGPISGNNSIVISGSHLNGATSVTFGGVAAVGFTASANSLTATAPAQAAGTVDITVTTPGGTVTLSNGYAYVAAPTISSVSPNVGPTSGVYSVTVGGTNLSDATSITFGGVSGAIMGRSATELQVAGPALYTPRTVDVVITTPGGTVTLANGFTAVDAPTITSVSPNSGSRNGGTVVTLTGTNLTGVSAVSFGGAAGGDIIIDSPTQLRVTTPARWDGVMDVTVTGPGGSAVSTGAFTYVSPTVAITSPANGATVSNPNVTATGTAAHATSVTVYLNSVSQGSVPVVAGAWSKSLGSLANGAHTVWAQATDGTTPSPIITSSFTVAMPVPVVHDRQPSSGPEGGGFSVVITGVGFTGASQVSFGGTAALGFTLDSDTQITATAPPGTGYVDVSVATPGGISLTGNSGTTFLYLASPTISLVAPGVGSTAGNTTVTLSGSNLAGATDVTFAGVSGAIVGTPTATSITVTTPAHAAGAVDVVVFTPNGPVTASNAFTYVTPAPTVSAFTAAPVSYNSGLAATTAIDLAARTSGGAVFYELNRGGAGTGAVTTTQGGVAAVNMGTGQVDYRPPVGFRGDDSFQYRAGNSELSGWATVTVPVGDPVFTVVLPETAGTVGVAYNSGGAAVTVTGGQAPYGRFSATGLPEGLTINEAGVISGVPETTSTATVVITLTDSSGGQGGYTSTAEASLTIGPPVIVLNPVAGSLPGAQAGVAYSQSITRSGGTAPMSYGVTRGDLPDGLALSSDGVISGTPTRAGVFPFTVTATDARGFTGSAAYTMEVVMPVPVVQPQTATVVAGQSVAINVAQGAVGLDITSVSVASTPSHGTAQVRELSVVYTANGDFSGTDTFTYTLNNAGGSSSPGMVTITVHPAVTTGPEKTATILAGQTATVELTEGATGSPFTGAAVVSVGPTGAGTAIIVPRTGSGGVQLYDVVFTPADSFTGQAQVLYTLSNAFTASAPGVVIITVEARPDPGLDPEVRGVATSQVTAARRFADAQVGNFQRRLQDLRHGTHASSNGLRLNIGLGDDNDDRDRRVALRRQLGRQASRMDPGMLNDRRDEDMPSLDRWRGYVPAENAASSVTDGRRNASPAAIADQTGRSVGFWSAGAIDWGRQDADGGRDTRFTTQGISVGLDVKISDSLIFGGGLGYGEDRTKVGDNGSLSEGSAVTGAVYASWRLAESFYIDGVVGYSDLDFNSRRWVVGLGGDPSGYASGDRSGDLLFVSAALGRVIRRGSLVATFMQAWMRAK